MNPVSYTASTSITVDASADRLWRALTDPDQIKEWLGAEVVTSWKKDSPVVYRGEWEGKKYEDKGVILEIDPPKVIRATYFSPLSGLEDRPENYSVVSYLLEPEDGKTKLTVTQTNCQTQELADQSAANWQKMLGGLRQLLVEG